MNGEWKINTKQGKRGGVREFILLMGHHVLGVLFYVFGTFDKLLLFSLETIIFHHTITKSSLSFFFIMIVSENKYKISWITFI